MRSYSEGLRRRMGGIMEVRRVPESKPKQDAIYSVTFHVNPKRRVHTFWFLDRDKASRFYESVKKHPKVLDYRMYRTPITDAEEYDGRMEANLILPVER